MSRITDRRELALRIGMYVEGMPVPDMSSDRWKLIRVANNSHAAAYSTTRPLWDIDWDRIMGANYCAACRCKHTGKPHKSRYSH